MTGSLYASLSELKQGLAIADAANDVDLERALETASRWIDGYTGRVFSLATAQTKDYYPQDTERVDVVDLVSVTSLTVDTSGTRTYSTTLSASDYELWPLGGPPYQQIRIWPLSSSRSFSPGRRVRVVGSFGCVVDGAAPTAVKQACLILANRYYVRKDAPFGVLSAVDLGQFERISKEDPDVVSLLGPWRLTGGVWVVV